MSLANALSFSEKVVTLRCIEGSAAVETISEIVEDWSAFGGDGRVGW